jgi:hypothetical protein
MKSISVVFILFCFSTPAFLQEKQNRSSSKNPQTIELTKDELPQTEEVAPNTPNAVSEKFFFKDINRRTDKAKLKSLTETEVAKNDIEVRLWFKVAFIKLEGMVLKRTKNVWSAVYLDTNYVSKRYLYPIIKYNRPKSGWDKMWQKLLKAEILTLPDADSIKCNNNSPDGETYIVELKKGNNYRTYMYVNPAPPPLDRCREAGQIVEIYKTIFHEFGIERIG